MKRTCRLRSAVKSISRACAEGFNNVVGTIKKQAYGFHDREYLKLKILRICGKLE